MDVTAAAVVLEEPLSFWGGYDPETGEVIEARCPNRGARTAGRVLVLPGTKGSSGGSAILAEAIRRGTGPVAIVLERMSLAVAIGTLTPEVLYGIRTPYAIVPGDVYAAIADGDPVRVTAGGRVELPGAPTR